MFARYCYGPVSVRLSVCHMNRYFIQTTERIEMF